MAIKTREELLNSIKDIVGESTEDNVLSIIEDIQDTFTDYENRASNNINWEQKYKDNDAEWRRKYKDRFYSGKSDEEFEDDDTYVEKKLTYDNLFKEEK